MDSAITVPATRLSLVAGQVLYEYQDSTGDPDYWYKVSYFNSTSSLESSLSEAQQGEGDTALDIMSVAEVKEIYLFGVDLTKDDGEAYPHTMFEFYIKSAVSWLEHKLDIPIRPTPYDERYDYFRQDYEQYISLYLDHYPVISIEAAQMIMPNEQTAFDFPTEWVHVKKQWGHLNIIPGVGSIGSVLLGASGAFLPWLTRADYLPDVFRVAYLAGFACGAVPDAIRDLVGKLASLGPLNIAGDLIVGAGIATQSISLDGVSQTIGTTSSATNAGYGARIIQYQREIKEALSTLQRYYKGIRLSVA